MTSLFGQIIGNYRLDALLGAGGMGQVYRARHVHLDTLAAVKVMHEHVAYDPKFRASFRDEARNAHALVHPNIVKILDFGDQDGRFYLVMELVTDGSLRVLLQGLQKLTLPLALDLVRQAAEGLAFAQLSGMVHRDLKPDNLLLSREERTGRQEYMVKISDFGLAKLAEGGVATSAGAQVGTPAYMSPEQCQGLPLDGRSDLYSLGVVLYEATTRYLPFEIHTPTDAVYKHVFAPPPPPRSVCPDLPLAVEAIILQCLAKSPEARYRDATELAGALQAVLAEIDHPVMAGVGGPALTLSPLTIVTPHQPPPVANRIAVTLPERTLTITPGQPATFPVTIANLGRTVDHFTITVEGVPREWVQVPPQPVQLNPNVNTTIRLTITAPRSPSAQAGDHAVTIVATSRDRPEDTGQQFALWTVLPFAALALELEPVQAAGRNGAQYSVVLTNEGNAEGAYKLRGSDDERALRYTFRSDAAMDDDDVVRIGGGKVARVRLRVGAPRRWIGTTQVRAFQVRATSPTNATGQTVTARFAHRPVVPAWAIPLAVLLVVAVSALLPFLFRPAVTGIAFDPPSVVPGQAITVRVTALRAREISFVEIAPPDAIGQETFTFSRGLPADTKQLTVRATNLFGSAEERFAVPLEPPPSVADARIDRFVVDRADVATGDTVTVTWQVSQAETIELQPFGTVDATGTQQFTIRTTGPAKETYTLVATNSAGRQVRRSIDVAVRAAAGPVLPAVIEEFAVEPTKARKGDTVTIRWRVSNAKSATLKPGGPVPLQGERSIEVQNHGPTQLSFALIAVNFTGQSVTQSATIALLPPAVVIDEFTAEPATAVEGQRVTVTWRVRNADVVEVSPFGRVDPMGRRTTGAAGPPSMEFDLTASASGQPPETRRAAVRIQPREVLPAVIEEFAVGPQKARKGDTVTIRWRVTNAKSAVLKPFGPVALQGERTFEVRNHGPMRLSYDLIAVNLADQTVTQSAIVAILPAPAVIIDEFTAEPASAVAGQRITVRWRVRNADVVEVSPFGRVEPVGRRTTGADARSMVFELTATASGQPAVTQRALVRVQPSGPPGPRGGVTNPGSRGRIGLDEVLRPETLVLRVSTATLKAVNPAMSGPCPLTVQFQGTIRATGPATVAYTFERSDGATGRVLRTQFTEAGTRQVSTSWTLGTNFRGWQRLKILSPSEMATTSEQAPFTVTCR